MVCRAVSWYRPSRRYVDLLQSQNFQPKLLVLNSQFVLSVSKRQQVIRSWQVPDKGTPFTIEFVICVRQRHTHTCQSKRVHPICRLVMLGMTGSDLLSNFRTITGRSDTTVLQALPGFMDCSISLTQRSKNGPGNLDSYQTLGIALCRSAKERFVAPKLGQSSICWDGLEVKEPTARGTRRGTISAFSAMYGFEMMTFNIKDGYLGMP